MSLDDIGVAGQPLNTPPLTAWQADVRDALKPLVPVLSTVVPASGWVDFGGAYGGLYMSRQGRLVVVSGMVKPTSDRAVTAGTSYPILTGADIPGRQAIYPCLYVVSGTTPLFGRVSIDATGAIAFIPAASGTITAAGGYVSAEFTYRTQT